MALATQTLVANLVAALKAALTISFAANGLPVPADADWLDFFPQLRPTSRTPMLAVEVHGWTQIGHMGVKGERHPVALVAYVLTGPDQALVAQQVRDAGDLICAALEGATVADAMKPVVRSADFDPDLLGGSASPLFRAVVITAELKQIRSRGDTT